MHRREAIIASQVRTLERVASNVATTRHASANVSWIRSSMRPAS